MRDIRKKRNPETTGRFGIFLDIPLLLIIYMLYLQRKTNMLGL